MVAYLGTVWGCRYFWLSLVRMDLRTRYRGSALGLGWSLLQPIAMTAILCTVFSKIFHADVMVYAPFLMSGLTFWNFVVTTSIQGTHCFFQGECYIRQYPAPMAIYPLRTLLGAAFHFSLALLLVIALTNGFRLYSVLFPRNEPGTVAAVPPPPSPAQPDASFHGVARLWPLLSLGPTVVLLLVFGWSLAVLFGLITVRFRDTHHITEVCFQGLFYLTPVMYPPDLLTLRGLGFLVDYHPFVPFLNLLRQPILDSTFPSLQTFGAACLVTVVTGGVASLALWKQERQLIFHL
jgi:ABC-type polysaccharide/polyol phosphate export permease